MGRYRRGSSTTWAVVGVANPPRLGRTRGQHVCNASEGIDNESRGSELSPRHRVTHKSHRISTGSKVLPGILQRLQWLHLITWYRYIFRTFVGIRGAAVGISLPRRNPPCIIPAIYYVYVSWYVAYIALNPLLMAH